MHGMRKKCKKTGTRQVEPCCGRRYLVYLRTSTRSDSNTLNNVMNIYQSMSSTSGLILLYREGKKTEYV